MIKNYNYQSIARKIFTTGCTKRVTFGMQRSKNFDRHHTLLSRPFSHLSTNISFAENRNSMSVLLLTLLGTMTAIGSVAVTHCDEAETTSNWPIYTKAEISSHKTKETGIWVTFKDGVYDVTDFVDNHPGGVDKILLAAGGPVEPFWRVYRQHYNTPLPVELLSEMRIGTMHPDDVAAAAAQPVDDSDPYAHDPELSPIMEIHQPKPNMAETPKALLAESWLTPQELMFVRNHHPIPIIDDPDNFPITIHIPKSKSKSPQVDCDCEEKQPKQKEGSEISADNEEFRTVDFTVSDLKRIFKPVTIISSVQCGGNRRQEMDTVDKTNGIPWGVGAIHTARWTGVLLKDLLAYSELDVQAFQTFEEYEYDHVQFESVDGLMASVPTHKVMNPHGDVLIAYELNGGPIPVAHGAPLRVIIPGHVGVRNVKWLNHVKLAKEEARGTWQRGLAYKGFGPSIKSADGINVEKLVSLQEQPVSSVITYPKKHIKLTPGVTSIHGYAYSGGGRGIIRVDVSADGGKTWKSANLTAGSEQPLHRAWAWTLWECDVAIPESAVNTSVELICKATDAAYNVQPDTVAGIWNLRGINNNSWYRVPVAVVSDEDS